MVAKDDKFAAMERHMAKMLAEPRAPLVKHEWQVKNCISYWYPQIQGVVQTPKTVIFRADVGIYDFMALLEQDPSPEIVKAGEAMLSNLEDACDILGYPAFLRTGTVSGKHSWKDTCFIESRDKVRSHFGCLLEDAAMKDQTLDVWAVREMLPTEPLFYAFHGRMPITRERRFFVDDGLVIGSLPYWPKEAFDDQYTSREDWPEVIASLDDEPDLDYLIGETLEVAQVLPGAWSVDWLKTKNGWYLIDCALAWMSWGYDKFNKRTEA